MQRRRLQKQRLKARQLVKQLQGKPEGTGEPRTEAPPVEGTA